VISVPNSKTKNAKGSIDSTTTEVAADLYRKKILSRHDGKNDYLFFNDIKDRTYAGDKVSKMFKYLVSRAGLEIDAYGQGSLIRRIRDSNEHAPDATYVGIDVNAVLPAALAGQGW
jgi:hypothetical protein